MKIISECRLVIDEYFEDLKKDLDPLVLIGIWSDIIMTLEFDTKGNAFDSLIKIYSQVNNFLPFKKTGMTGAYKDIGDYTDLILIK